MTACERLSEGNAASDGIAMISWQSASALLSRPLTSLPNTIATRLFMSSGASSAAVSRGGCIFRRNFPACLDVPMTRVWSAIASASEENCFALVRIPFAPADNLAASWASSVGGFTSINRDRPMFIMHREVAPIFAGVLVSTRTMLILSRTEDFCMIVVGRMPVYLPSLLYGGPAFHLTGMCGQHSCKYFRRKKAILTLAGWPAKVQPT